MAQTASQPSVTIENLVQQAHVFNLPHTIMGPNFAVRQLVGARRYRGKGPRWRGGYKKLSTSITVRPKGKEGDHVIGLPRAVKRCPEVAAAEKRGDIKLHYLSAEETAEQAAKAAAAAEAKAKRQVDEQARLKAKRTAKTKAMTDLQKPAATPERPRRRRATTEEEG